MADNFLCRYEKALRYSMNTYPIGDSPLEISAACRGFAPLQNRAEITVVMCDQRSYPVSVSSSAKALRQSVNKASVQRIEMKIVTDLELKKKRVEIVTSGNIYYYALYSLFVFSLAKSSMNESFASL